MAYATGLFLDHCISGDNRSTSRSSTGASSTLHPDYTPPSMSTLSLDSSSDLPHINSAFDFLFESPSSRNSPQSGIVNESYFHEYFDFDLAQKDGLLLEPCEDMTRRPSNGGSGPASSPRSSFHNSTPSLTDASTGTTPEHHLDHLGGALTPGAAHDAYGEIHNDDSLLFPTVSRQSPPREPHIDLHANGSPRSSSTMLPTSGHGSKRARSDSRSSVMNGNSKSKKRAIRPSEKTQEMRDAGACIRCRIKRTRCDVKSCEHCKKLAKELVEKVCIHEHLPNIGPVFKHVAEKKFDQNGSLSRDLTGARAVKVPVTFSPDDGEAPRLMLSIQEFKAPNKLMKQGPNCAISRDAMPLWPELTHWAGQQLLRDAQQTPFIRSLSAFFIGYVDKSNETDIKLPRLALMTNVWTFAAMFKIWRTHPSKTATALYCRGSSKGTVRLPPSVQEELRRIAKTAMVTLETNILQELETCMTQAGNVKPEEKPLIWACLWELLWCYRGLLKELVAFCRMIKGYRSPAPQHCLSVQKCCDVAEKLYAALIAFYTGFFDKPKSLQMELNFISARADVHVMDELRGLFDNLLDQRIDFYQDLKIQDKEVDNVLNAVIIEGELKRLRKGKKKGISNSVRGGHEGEEEGEDDDE